MIMVVFLKYTVINATKDLFKKDLRSLKIKTQIGLTTPLKQIKTLLNIKSVLLLCCPNLAVNAHIRLAQHGFYVFLCSREFNAR